MQIVRELAGYSLGRADLVRRAMGKKKLDVMAKEREVFINGQVDENGNIEVPGCVRNGIDEKSANKIFDEMAEFAKYAFNKSHAACYAVVAYRTAYLKAYYPSEFMAATLNSYLGNLDKIPQYIDECRRMGIEILKPDINKSYSKFTVENNKIRFGMGSIKNVGIAPVETIVKEREENGKYKGFIDFCERTIEKGVNKKCVESLIKAGVFSEFTKTRATLLASFEQIIEAIQASNKKGINGQVTLFDLGTKEEKEEMQKNKYVFEEYKEMNERELLSMEKEILGIYISGHPLEKYRKQIEMQTNITTIDLRKIDEEMNSQTENIEKLEYRDGQNVKYGGIITSIKKKYTKNNKIMAFVTIEDLYGTAEIIVFEPAYFKSKESLIEENIVLVDGRLSMREDDTTTIIANEITNFKEKEHKILIFDINELEEAKKAQLRGGIKYFSGDKNNINVYVREKEKELPCGSIYLTNEILEIFKKIIGEERVILAKTGQKNENE